MLEHTLTVSVAGVAYIAALLTTYVYTAALAQQDSFVQGWSP